MGKKNLALAHAIAHGEVDCCGSHPCKREGATWVIGEDEYNSCPQKQITPQSRQLIIASACRKDGVLPYDCGWWELPNAMTEAFMLLNKLDADNRRRGGQA